MAFAIFKSISNIYLWKHFILYLINILTEYTVTRPGHTKLLITITPLFTLFVYILAIGL